MGEKGRKEPVPKAPRILNAISGPDTRPPNPRLGHYIDPPRLSDSTEKVHEYFRDYICIITGRFPNHPYIRELKFRFHGTGADLYAASKDQISWWIGDSNMGAIIHRDLELHYYGGVSPSPPPPHVPISIYTIYNLGNNVTLLTIMFSSTNIIES